MSKTIANNYINHVVFVLDRSGSMENLRNNVVSVFDDQVKYLAKRSQELDQETRVSTYLFSEDAECLTYDKDCLRLPSLKSYYDPEGGTGLIDATLLAIEDLEKTATLYGDHAFLIYVLTDGEENRSSKTAADLSKRIKNLPENWTLGVLVPNKNGVAEAKRFGFPEQNVQIWETTGKGLDKANEVIKKATNNFFVNRSKGIKGTKSLFDLDLTGVSSKVIKNKLDELKANEYELLPVQREKDIKSFVESWIKTPYVKGSSYYQLTKPETIQNYKQICIQEKSNGKVYSGQSARELLGLPDYEIKVSPANFGKYDIFVQSTSSNRKLMPGTKLIVLK
jgi:hypothetical protein